MPGQNYHLNIAKMILLKGANIYDYNAYITGALCVDGLNTMVNRRCSHFTGGAGCIFPRYSELRAVTNLQNWDSRMERSTFVDPKIDIELFEFSNRHLLEDNQDFYKGILVHLIADKEYDKYIQQDLFALTDKSAKLISTGEVMEPAEFRSELYKSYPALDNLFATDADVSQRYIKETKNLIMATMETSSAEFVIKYLNDINPDFVWKDTRVFKENELRELVERTVKRLLQIGI